MSWIINYSCRALSELKIYEIYLKEVFFAKIIGCKSKFTFENIIKYVALLLHFETLCLFCANAADILFVHIPIF